MKPNLNFESLFDSTYRSLLTKKYQFQESAAATESFNRAIVLDSSEIPLAPQEQYELQRSIRPIFGKSGINTSPIGTHPNFISLENTDGDTQNHYTCTLFVDIKGSTRLSLLYPLEEVFTFKNAVIKTCIESVRALDGHVHRIMGDAVMAFFAQQEGDKEDSIANAINCSVTLRMMLEEGIKPWMEKKGFDGKDFAFRVGCDFGDDEQVLWGSYGYSGVGEVSATGLQVDMASKLQNLAKKNQTMLGQSIIEYIDFPDYYLRTKTIEKDGQFISQPFVTPNLTRNDGTSINYLMKLTQYEKLIELSPLPIHIRERITQRITQQSVIGNPLIEYKCYTVDDSNNQREYISVSKFLEKNISLRFELAAMTNGRLKFPLTVVFTKTNHGTQARKNNEDKTYQPTIKILSNPTSSYSHSPQRKVLIDEATLYRGLHTMQCMVKDSENRIIFRDWIGVMIK